MDNVNHEHNGIEMGDNSSGGNVLDLPKHEQFERFVLCLIILSIFVICTLILSFLLRIIQHGQKTRNPQQRRTYIGTRSRTSLPPTEPTIYVSPANLPPPPKYEAMAPPSYEEVVGIHYPPYQPAAQPINQPITTALASQSSNSACNATDNANSVASNDATLHVANEPATITTVDERRAVTAAS